MTRLIFASLALVIILSVSRSYGQQAGRSFTTRGGRWVGTWTASVQLTEPGNLPPAPGLADTTLRQIVHVSIGGRRLRVRFSNAFGTRPLTITSAHVALPAGAGAIDAGTDTPLTFSGSVSVVIPPGAPAVSDPVDFALAPLSNLAITIHVTDPTMSITGHPGSRTTSYLQAGDSVSAAILLSAATTAHWYYIEGVDVVVERSAAALITLGDSITDGRGSTTDENDRWPDQLARRLQANRGTGGVAVLNAGIGGNCVLTGGLGPSAVARLDRDLLAQPGARWVIVFEGINDLGSRSASADDLIAAYRQIIARAHESGIMAYGATITPCGGSSYASPRLETERLKLNTWIRTSGEFDAVVDFDAAVRDPAEPGRLLAAADSGDHLHLSPTGYKILAKAVDLKLFGRR